MSRPGHEVPTPNLKPIPHARPCLVRLLSQPLRPLLQVLELLGSPSSRGALGVVAVGADGRLRVRGQFGLPVALALLLLAEGVLLVLFIFLWGLYGGGVLGLATSWFRGGG